MPEGVVKGSWTPCPKAKVEGGREAPQRPKAKVRLGGAALDASQPEGGVSTAINGDRQERWGGCQCPHVYRHAVKGGGPPISLRREGCGL